MTSDAARGAQIAPAAATGPGAATPRGLKEVVRQFKLELVSGQGFGHDRGSGFDPYNRGSTRDVWARRRRA